MNLQLQFGNGCPCTITLRLGCHGKCICFDMRKIVTEVFDAFMPCVVSFVKHIPGALGSNLVLASCGPDVAEMEIVPCCVDQHMANCDACGSLVVQIVFYCHCVAFSTQHVLEIFSR